MEYIRFSLSPAPQVVFSHTHTTDRLNNHFPAVRDLLEVSLMEAGPVTHRLEGMEDLLVQEGDVTILPPRRAAHVSSLPGSPVHSHTTAAVRLAGGFAYVNPQDIRTEREQLERRPENEPLAAAFLPRLLPSPFVTPLAKQLFKSLARENMTRGFGYASLLSSLFTALSVELTRACFASLDALHATPSNLLLISSLKEYLAQNFSQELSLDELAAWLGINKQYMCNLFKRFTGSTIITYRNLLRIQHFKSLARMGGLKIGEMAHLSGFSDEFYFSKTFKKLEGISPSEYLSLLKTYYHHPAGRSP